MNAPIDVCERRDVKGIYRRARAGEIGHVTGVDDPYEPPLAPDIGRRTDRETPAESAASVLRAVDLWQARPAHGLIEPGKRGHSPRFQCCEPPSIGYRRAGADITVIYGYALRVR